MVMAAVGALLALGYWNATAVTTAFVSNAADFVGNVSTNSLQRSQELS